MCPNGLLRSMARLARVTVIEVRESGNTWLMNAVTERSVVSCVLITTQFQAAMVCCALFAAFSIVVLLYQSEMVMSTYLPLTVTETTNYTVVNVTGNSSVSIVTSEDVERTLREKDAVIIDVRTFKEAAELGQIPSAHVLPGYTATLGCYVRYLSNKR